MAAPTEGMKMVARSLIGEPLGKAEKNELYLEVGRAVVSLSNVENVLSLLFAVLGPGGSIEAASFFHQQSGFERKLALVHLILKDDAYAADRWLKIHKVLTVHRGIRNLIAHQGMSVQNGNDPTKITVALTPPWLKKKSSGQKLDVARIRTTADAIEKADADLWKLLVDIQPSRRK